MRDKHPDLDGELRERAQALAAHQSASHALYLEARTAFERTDENQPQRNTAGEENKFQMMRIQTMKAIAKLQMDSEYQKGRMDGFIDCLVIMATTKEAQ